MNDRDFKFPGWQTVLQELMFEFDREKFHSRRPAVENLLHERIHQLNQANEGNEELRALNFALSIIRMTERDRFTRT